MNLFLTLCCNYLSSFFLAGSFTERQKEKPVNCKEEDHGIPCQDDKFAITLVSQKFKIQFRKMYCDWPIFFKMPYISCYYNGIIVIFDDVSHIL